jgi:hypothetical protein
MGISLTIENTVFASSAKTVSPIEAKARVDFHPSPNGFSHSENVVGVWLG